MTKPKSQVAGELPPPPVVSLPPEILAATAYIYSGVLLALDCGPALGKAEHDALCAALDAVAKRYAGNFQHVELVVLAMALTAPLITRIPQRVERKRLEAEAKLPSGKASAPVQIAN